MKKFLRATLAFALTLSATLGFTACDSLFGTNPSNPPPEEEVGESYVQQLDVTESTATIDNPDQGFYHPLLVKVTETGVVYNTGAILPTRLCHLRFDLSDFSQNAGGTDKPLTQAALNGISNVFEEMRKRDKNAVVRFCYDRGYSGNGRSGTAIEPPLTTMQTHARQFCTVVEKYSAVVTVLELGMVGPWGEMHTTAAAKSPTVVTALIKTFLENTSTVPVTVRTPKRIYDYLGITINDIATYKMPATAYRLGMYNDGYLGSDSDLGTFTDRKKEIAFLAKQNEHLPYGGEVTEPSSTLHQIKTCLPEMYQIRLSYLNEEWNDTVVKGWKEQKVDETCARADSVYYGKSAYVYIRNHMGYRFVLETSTFTYAEKLNSLKVSLTLKNVGFGNMNKKKRAKLLFTDQKNTVKYSVSVENFDGANTANFSANLAALKMTSGTYRVYLQLFGDYLSDYNLAIYCVQFANNGIYDSSLKANRIGEITIP